jgi:hypothetical protein
VDPRTFLPARALALSPPPQPGEPARRLPVELEYDRAAVIAFLRHTGCPFAELTMRGMREAAAAAPQVQWLAISHAPDDATARWCHAVGVRDEVVVVSDSSRQLYAEWGLGRTNLGHFLGRRSLAAVRSLAREGIRNRHPHGTRWQSAGTFALDERGTVRWSHLPAHAGDVPDLQLALRALSVSSP